MKRRAFRPVVLVPLLGILLVGSIPFVRYAQKNAAEATVTEALGRLHRAQQSFQTRTGSGYASDVASLITACPGQSTSALDPTVVRDVDRADYRMTLRGAQDATSIGTDCHGRALVSDYYAAVQPRRSTTAGERAYALTSIGRIFLFYDGMPPLERDMVSGGLATPLESAAAFKIP